MSCLRIPAVMASILLLQGISWISCEDHEGGDPLDWLRNSIPGEPGVDYPIFGSVGDTSFSCDGLIFGGYYADPELECQAYHVCLQDALTPNSLYPVSFLCPNGTIFSQEIFTCDWWYNVDCAASEGLYAGAEGAFGGNGGDGGADGGAGSCPAVTGDFPPEQCAGAVSNCWSPGFTDTDCPNNGLCCFDGCADTCVDGPKPDPAPAPTPVIDSESAQEPQFVPQPLPGTTTPATTTTTKKAGYDYPVPENPLIIEKPAPGLPTLYGAPPIGRK